MSGDLFSPPHILPFQVYRESKAILGCWFGGFPYDSSGESKILLAFPTRIRWWFLKKNRFLEKAVQSNNSLELDSLPLRLINPHSPPPLSAHTDSSSGRESQIYLFILPLLFILSSVPGTRNCSRVFTLHLLLPIQANCQFFIIFGSNLWPQDLKSLCNEAGDKAWFGGIPAHAHSHQVSFRICSTVSSSNLSVPPVASLEGWQKLWSLCYIQELCVCVWLQC